MPAAPTITETISSSSSGDDVGSGEAAGVGTTGNGVGVGGTVGAGRA